MKSLAETKVSRIVAENYKTATVFTRHGIDFCCNGGIPLQEACALKEVELDQVMEELERALALPTEEDYQQLSLPDLVDHIVEVHHSYVGATIPVLQAYLEKISSVHGDRHPELVEIRDLFQEAALNLTAHMKKEEFILFPFIKAMSTTDQDEALLAAPFGHIDHPIDMMEHEHSAEGARFRKIARLSGQYTPPTDACQTYRVAFALLEDFERDLHKHIHLENNVLFPASREKFGNLKVEVSSET